MADTKQKIGDPLADAAQSGVLSGRRPIGTKEPGGPATPAERESAPAKQPEPGPPIDAGRVSTRKPKREREKKTILFETERAKWLEIQAATERREMSEIVADALELYERLHEKEK